MRLDLYLVEHNHVKTRSQATDLIKRGFILVNDEVVSKAGIVIKDTDKVTILRSVKFVSRAGEKLDGFLDEINYDVKDKIVVDVGSSTGGFTNCLLNRGAKHIYAYDVGSNQMDENLRLNPNISLFEETNILDVSLNNVDLIVIDVSFTSIVPIIKHVYKATKEIIALIKPQFEVGKTNIKKGLVKEEILHEKVLMNLKNEFEELGLKIITQKKSSVVGKKGNVEYFMYLIN